jgi:hypothetical protein
MITVYSSNRLSDERVLDRMSRDGPHYIFSISASEWREDGFAVGGLIRLGGQPFVVRRLCTKEEFLANCARTRVVPQATGSRVYFEGVTD